MENRRNSGIRDYRLSLSAYVSYDDRICKSYRSVKLTVERQGFDRGDEGCCKPISEVRRRV